MFHINFLQSPYTVKNIPCGKPSHHLHHHHLPPSLALQVSNVYLTRWNSSVQALVTLMPTLIYPARSGGVSLQTNRFLLACKADQYFFTEQSFLKMALIPWTPSSSTPKHHRYTNHGVIKAFCDQGAQPSVHHYHVPIHRSLNPSRDGSSTASQPLPMPGHHFCQEIFPNIQS